MSSRIIKAKAYTNGEVGYISWQVDSMIHGCLGFEITRIFPDDASQNKKLAAWVPFKGQSNPDWKPQDTGVWPIQKLNWRDLTLIKSRDTLHSRGQGFRVQYLIRPVMAETAGLEPVITTLPITYTGTPVKLSYLDKGLLTNIITVSTQYGDIRATFTNGILATQALSNILKNEDKPLKKLKEDIATKNNSVRKYLTGEVLATLKLLLQKAKDNPGSSLKMAIYEFDDQELFETLMAVKDQVEIVLSNTSNGATAHKPPVWDKENADFRQKLTDARVNIHNRFFNNDGHIGHNKFVIYLNSNGIPKSVLTGSTNWTPNGLCAQSNNATIIDSDEIAKFYDNYFEALKQDTSLFAIPAPTSDTTKNVQGSIFRKRNIAGNPSVTLADGTTITVWFSPNTIKTSVNKTVIPPDLSQVYSLMRKAEKAIFFAVFLPGTATDTNPNDIMTNIITEAMSIGSLDVSLMVYGAISSPMAMPVDNLSAEGAINTNSSGATKPPAPTTFDKNNVHIIRAFNITTTDATGDFKPELLSAGNAIIHDKIIVIDPFSPNASLIFGSHNMGFKASYANDENLVIIQNNPALIQAYAIHVLDIYEHYRFRAVQEELHEDGKAGFDGFLSNNDAWLEQDLINSTKGSLSDYMCS